MGHPAVLLPPTIKGVLSDAVAASNLADGALLALGLAENLDDLLL